MNRRRTGPVCQRCDREMDVIRRAIAPNGASRPKSAECRDCEIRWKRGAGYERVEDQEPAIASTGARGESA